MTDQTLADSLARRRARTAFGWISGGSLGLLLDGIAYAVIGDAYPLELLTFAWFVAGAFAGMAVADRLGPRGFRPLGVAAGVLLAATVTMALVVWMTRLGP